MSKRATGIVSTALLTVLLAQGLLFALLTTAPGDAVDLMSPSSAARPALEEALGLQGSAGQRLLRHLGNLATGDLGMSVGVAPGRSVGSLIAGPVASSAALGLVALFLTIAAAWLAVVFDGRRVAAVRLVALLPAFLLAHILVGSTNAAVWWGVQADWWSRPAWFALPDVDHSLRDALAIALLAAASGMWAEASDDVSTAWQTFGSAPFVEAARARRESIRGMAIHHMGLATIELAARRVPWLLGSLLVVERVLLIPGAGALTWKAAELRDVPVVLALGLAAATATALATALASGARAAIDPRLGP